MITNDISRIFSLSISDSERIKIINGQLIEELENSLSVIEVDSLGGEYDSIEITRKDLIAVIKPRVNEIINSIKDQIVKSGYNHLIANRVVITGGAAQMEGFIDITSRTLEKKARLGKVNIIKGVPDNMRSSSFSAINSLLNYSMINNNDISSKSITKKNKPEGFYAYILKFKSWIMENF